MRLPCLPYLSAPLLLTLLLALLPAGELLSQERAVEKTWLLGVGRASELDTYLSPHTYRGPAASLIHHTQRLARFGAGRWAVVSDYGLHLARPKMPADGDKCLAASLRASVGTLRWWNAAQGLALSLGPMGQLSAGGTYMERGGNNPAQARLWGSVGIEGQADWHFRLGRLPLRARLSASAPVLGVAFTPHYGESYYEVFALDGNASGHVRCTTPWSAPSGRVQLVVSVPVLGATLTAGYQGEAEQSKLCGLRHHSWTHTALLGFTRTLVIKR